MSRSETEGLQIDYLFGKPQCTRPAREIPAAREGRRVAGPDSRADIGSPGGDTRLEARVREQVRIGGWRALIAQRIAVVHGRTRETLTGYQVKGPVIIGGAVIESWFGPIRINCGAANGVQVESCDVGLQIENVDKILGPKGDSTGAAGMKIVVITEEAALTAVGGVDVVTGLGPDDVVANLDVTGSALDVNAVAERRVDRIVDDADVGLAVNEDPCLGVPIN